MTSHVLSTPNANRETVWERWVSHASRQPARPAIIHWRAGEEPTVWSRGDLVADALRYATLLHGVGVRRGDTCALMLRHDARVYPVYMAFSAIGAIPSILAYPNDRLHPEKFAAGFLAMARRSGLSWLFTERDLEARVTAMVPAGTTSLRGTFFPFDWNTAGTAPFGGAERVDSSEPCLLQHSSGTTGMQKAVMLSHRAVLDHVARYGDAIGLNEGDCIASWLPLYHDMGLIAAFHLPLAAGVPTLQIDPFEWISMPSLLLQAISEHKATLCWMPNFAYNFTADRVPEEDLEGVALDSVRLFVNCSEPVRAASHRRFLERFAPYGLRPQALGASYAMAETTFAVTQTSPGEPAPVVEVDRASLAAGVCRPPSGGPSRECVSSGRPIAGCSVRVVDDQGRDLPDDTVGELWIQSVSLFDGYRNDADKTAKVLSGGWYRSGDYGFRRAEQVYVVGRKKDLLIVAGKNLYPEDIEDAVGAVAGAIPGRVVAFGREDEARGTEEVCVVVETPATGDEDRAALRAAVVRAAMVIDVTIGRVYLAPPRWLIKSSSGKMSRTANRERVLRGDLDGPLAANGESR